MKKYIEIDMEFLNEEDIADGLRFISNQISEGFTSGYNQKGSWQILTNK